MTNAKKSAVRATRPQWTFEDILYGDTEKRGSVKVQPNSGHETLRINYETNQVSAGGFMYYATWYGDDGSKEKFAISREGLEALRNRPSGQPESEVRA